MLLASVAEHVVRREQEKKWAVKRVQLRWEEAVRGVGGGAWCNINAESLTHRQAKGCVRFQNVFHIERLRACVGRQRVCFKVAEGIVKVAALIRLTCSGSASSPDAAPLNNGK